VGRTYDAGQVRDMHPSPAYFQPVFLRRMPPLFGEMQGYFQFLFPFFLEIKKAQLPLQSGL